MSDTTAVEIAARLAGIEPGEVHYSLHHFLTDAAQTISEFRLTISWTDERVLALCRAWAALAEWPYIGGAALEGSVWLWHERRKQKRAEVTP